MFLKSIPVRARRVPLPATLLALVTAVVLATLAVGEVGAQARNAKSAPAAQAAQEAPKASPAVTSEVSREAPKAIAARIGKVLEPLLGGRKVEEVRTTPIAGIYEARFFEPRAGHLMLYVDEQARYMFYEGDLIEIEGVRNLTQERVEELTAIRFEDLPLELAVKQVIGKGSRRIAVFEDPNCGYCKRLRADLVKLDDLTLYTFPMAFLAADSESKARRALCAKDPARAWNDLLLENRVDDNPGTCDTSIEKVRVLAEGLGITGTPVVFFQNGRRLSGYEPPERFSRRLDNNSKKI
jgi:thiol:disulfide interchange protein DsbC